MADRIPTYLVGSSPNFTAIGQLGSDDRLIGVVNHADLVQNSIIFKNAQGVVEAKTLTNNTFLGNTGSGVAAVSAAQLVALMFAEFSATTRGTVLAYTGTTWETLAPGSENQVLAVSAAAASGLAYVDLPTGGVDTLGGLTDTTVTSPVDKEFLKYNGANWVNDTIETTDLSWIDISGIQPGEGLAWDAGQGRFEPTTLGGSTGLLSGITVDTSLVMGIHNVQFGTGGVDFTSTMDIGSASWSLTDTGSDFIITGDGNARFSIDNTGHVTLPYYDRTRDDTSSGDPQNFLYTDQNGVLRSAPINDANFATWADLRLSDLVNVQSSQVITTGHVLTYTGSEWAAQAPTVDGQALTAITTNLTLSVGRGYLLASGSSVTLTLPANSSTGDQVKLILADGDWRNSGVTINPGAGDNIFSGQTEPFLAYSSTLYLTYDEPGNNWIGSV